MPDYDIITIGGGLGGASLAKTMAESGYKVLVIERETQFKDRVRGEFMLPWGVGDTKNLGIYDTLMDSGGYHPEIFQAFAGPAPLPPRNLEETTPQGVHALTFFHPEMQEALIEAAEKAGAEVRRGVKVTAAKTGSEPRVQIDGDGGTETRTARLVVGSDGRNSVARKWGGFETTQVRHGNQLGGVLVENMPDDGNTSTLVLNPILGQCALYFPQGPGHGRFYFGNRVESGLRLQGDGDVPRMFEESINAGYPADKLEGAKQAGPFATFEGLDDFVEHPYKEGIALIGDAAATSDQTWGQGLSLTARDVRFLRDELVATDDWDAAGHAYAEKHDANYAAIREAEHWFTTVFMDPRPEAMTIRAKVLPLMMDDPTIVPDTTMIGPEHGPVTEAQRQALIV